MKKSFILLAFLTAFIAAAESFSFYMISDTHFGRAESFPKTRSEKFKFRIPPQPHRADIAMPVYEAVFKDMTAKAQADKKIKFLIQCGDFAEGAAKDAETYKKELAHALAFFDKHIKLPVYHVKGNHDNYGPGGDEAFNSILLPVIARSAGQKEMKFANYTFSRGKDLFIVLDYNKKANWKKFLKTTLKELEKSPRYLFVVIHTPFISDWAPQETEEICDLLLNYNTILLSGHIHSNTIVQYSKNGKSLIQATVGSGFPARKKGTTVCLKSKQTLDEFKKKLFVKVKNADRKAAGEKWAKNLSSFTRVSGVGYARFDVSDEGVSVSYQGTNLSRKPYKVQLIKNK